PDPASPSNVMGLLRSGFTLPGGFAQTDSLTSVPTFNGTTSLEFDARLQSPTHQNFVRLGNFSIGFDGDIFRFMGGFNYYPVPFDQTVHIRMIYEPTQGIADVVLSKMNGTVLFHTIACSGSQVGGPYDLEMG